MSDGDRQMARRDVSLHIVPSCNRSFVPSEQRASVRSDVNRLSMAGSTMPTRLSRPRDRATWWAGPDRKDCRRGSGAGPPACSTADLQGLHYVQTNLLVAGSADHPDGADFHFAIDQHPGCGDALPD